MMNLRLLVLIGMFLCTLSLPARADCDLNYGERNNTVSLLQEVCNNQGARGATSTHAASTIDVTNTFQAALAASTTRKSCLLQNQSARTMYVFFGAIGSATTSNSLQLAAGQSISCGAAGGVVATDAVNITGTAGDAYIVISQ